MNELPPKPINEFIKLKQKYEERLWDEATHLQETREALLARQQDIYAQLNDSHHPIADFNARKKLEDEYWGIPNSLKAVSNKEMEIQLLLEKLNNGSINETELKTFFPTEDQKTEKNRITKNKTRRLEQLKAIREGASEIFFDINGFDYSHSHPRGSVLEPNRLTTGRHAKSVKNISSPLNASEEFYYQTADTHGGKVKYGKNGYSYVGKSGKKIRKK